MKKLIYLVILFVFVAFLGLREVNPMQASEQSSVINENKKAVKEKNPTIHLQTINSEPSGKTPFSFGIKRIKCIEPIVYCFPNEHIYKIQVVENDLFLTPQKLHLLRLFFSNEKRGPPSDILIS